MKQLAALLGSADEELIPKTSLVRLYAFYKIATVGNPPPRTESRSRNTEIGAEAETSYEMFKAWRMLSSMDTIDAKTRFVKELSYVLPCWQYAELEEVPSSQNAAPSTNSSIFSTWSRFRTKQGQE